MNAVRRETSPSSGFDWKVVITKLPSSGNSEIGPTSWGFTPCLRNAGPTAKPSTGSVMRPPITAPSPSVVPSRKTERDTGSSPVVVRAGRGTAAGARGSFFSGSTGGASLASPLPRVSSLTQRKRKSTAIAAPIATIHQETTKPTSSTTTPRARPTGQRLGPGACGCSRLGSKSLATNITSGYFVTEATRDRNYAENRSGLLRDRVRTRTRPSAGRRAHGSRRSSRSRPATPGHPPRAASPWRRSRACRRRTGARWHGRDGRRAPR